MFSPHIIIICEHSLLNIYYRCGGVDAFFRWLCCIFFFRFFHSFAVIVSYAKRRRDRRNWCISVSRSPILAGNHSMHARARTSGYTSSRDQMVASCMKIFVTVSKYVKFVFNIPVNFWFEIRCRFGKVYCEVLGPVCKFNYSSSSAPVILLEAMCIFWFIINAVTIVIGGSPNLDNSNVAHFCSGCVQW